MKTRFVVIEENILGYINPAQPNVVGILATSILRGATKTWQDGWMFVPQKGMRPATRADFDTFRISTKGYESDPRYDFPSK